MKSIDASAFALRGAAPLHHQVAATVRRLIGRGDAEPGDRLPTARDLAARLGINTNTVLRAYRELANDDLLDLRPGRGATIRDIPDVARLHHLADELVAEAMRLGVSRGELAALLVERM